jgi:hypothetical protein
MIVKNVRRAVGDGFVTIASGRCEASLVDVVVLEVVHMLREEACTTSVALVREPTHPD